MRPNSNFAAIIPNMRCSNLLSFATLSLAGAATVRREPKTCTVAASGTNKTDDAPAIRSAFSECGLGGKVVFQPTTYYINSVLNITGLDDVDIDINGKLLVCFHAIKQNFCAKHAVVEYRHRILAQSFNA